MHCTEQHLRLVAIVLACRCWATSSEFSTTRTLDGERVGENKCLYKAAQAEEDDTSLLQLAIITYKDDQHNKVGQKMAPKEMDKSRQDKGEAKYFHQDSFGQIEDYMYKDLKRPSMYVGETAPNEPKKNLKGVGHLDDYNQSLLQLFTEHLHSLKRIDTMGFLILVVAVFFIGSVIGIALALALTQDQHPDNKPSGARNLPPSGSDDFRTRTPADEAAMEDAKGQYGGQFAAVVAKSAEAEAQKKKPSKALVIVPRSKNSKLRASSMGAQPPSDTFGPYLTHPSSVGYNTGQSDPTCC